MDILRDSCTEILRATNRTIEKIKDYNELNDSVMIEDDIMVANDLFYSEEVDIIGTTIDETTILDEFTKDITSIINQLKKTVGHDSDSFEYLLDNLQPFHFIDDHFTEPFTNDSLSDFQEMLKSFVQSLDAYEGTINGSLESVKKFIENNPSYKDRTLLHGETLLYSATKNKHFEIIKYLVDIEKCSVNICNQDDPKTNKDTPLHIACVNKVGEIIQYLLQNGADCYALDKYAQTPLMFVEISSSIFDIFKKHLVLHYDKSLASTCEIPKSRISSQLAGLNYDIGLLRIDCVWEFKMKDQDEWQTLNQLEATALSNNFRNKDNLSINLQLDGELLPTVSVKEFSRKQSESQFSWIRCRGSSVYNFDIICRWQMMLTSHPSVVDDQFREPTELPIDIPSIFDPNTFQYCVNSWYNIDDIMSKSIDDAMDKRLHYLSVESRLAGPIIIDLESFSFNNASATIQGFLRWLPKLVSIDTNTKQITAVDNFQDIDFTKTPPKALGHKLLAELSRKSDDDHALDVVMGSSDLYSDNMTDGTDSIQTVSETASFIADFDTVSTEDSDDFSTADPDNLSSPELVALIHREMKSQQYELDKEKANMKTFEKKMKDAEDSMAKIQKEKQDREEKYQLIQILAASLTDSFEDPELKLLREKYSDQEKLIKNYTDELKKREQKCENLNKNLKDCQNKLKIFENKQRREQEAVDNIVDITYHIPRTVEIQLIASDVEKYLKELNYPGKTDEQEKLVRITELGDQREINCLTWMLNGYISHHDEMRRICSRILKLIRILQKQRKIYHYQLRKEMGTLLKNVFQTKIICSRSNWQLFSEMFKKVFDEKTEALAQKLNETIGVRVKELIKPAMLDSDNWANQLDNERETYAKSNDVTKHIEEWKSLALNRFLVKITEKCETERDFKKVAEQRKKELIDRTTEVLTVDPKYRGHEPKHFTLLSSIIHRVHLIIQCFKLRLPLFESSTLLLDQIRNHTVTAISTQTGSGKSTLLPCLLAADGYEKIYVTQPRRLPCNLLSKRVNSSMEHPGLSGWCVSGAKSRNLKRASVVYLTDGLMKEYLLYGLRKLLHQVNSSESGIIIMIDEVHERSINIDLCLTFLARLLDKNPLLRSKIRVIIASATLHPSVAQTFTRFGIYSADFTTSVLHDVQTKPVSREHLIELVAELNKNLKREEQILCFVKSTTEVYESIKLLSLLKNLPSYPLVQSQSTVEQLRFIDEKSIFFSTTVAETSLTFPSLKYVIDTGMIHMPVYDPETGITMVQALKAAESTIKQRKGRLGRTRPGEYYPLYDFDPTVKKYPEPQITQTEVTYLEFHLRRSPLRLGLENLLQWMPDRPSNKAIDAAKTKLRNLGILDKDDKFTDLGSALSFLPDFGSISMTLTVYAALVKYECGRDVIRLACFLGVVNTSSLLKYIPATYIRPEGDFMTLLQVIDAVLDKKDHIPPHMFDIPTVCQSLGLSKIENDIRRAIGRYESVSKYLQKSIKYRNKVGKSSDGRWEPIARSFLDGYSDNVFLSMVDIHGRKHRYIRYTVKASSDRERYAVVDSTSKLSRQLKENPVSLVFSRDVQISASMRNRAIISFLGEISSDWLDRSIERDMEVTKSEGYAHSTTLSSDPLFSNVSAGLQIILEDKTIVLKGAGGRALQTEIFIRKKFVEKKSIFMIDDTADEKLKKSVKDLMNHLKIFAPMKWRWQAEKQVEIKFSSKSSNGEVIVIAREENYKSVQREISSFVGWLKTCVSLCPDSGPAPARYLNSTTKARSEDIESRIQAVTDTKLTPADLWPKLVGSSVTRESRMEVVAWIAVCHFHCKLEGGFVRDWIVAKTSERPPIPPSQWIQGTSSIPAIDKRVIPTDLDCHLPHDRYFDIEQFLDELHKFNIETEYKRQPWRYIFVFDRNHPTGPFSMDLIEPHVAFTHNRIDFDVNNLYVARELCNELGQRVDLRNPPFSIDLPNIVEQIKKKQFRLLRPVDTIISERIQKMQTRGWEKIGVDLNYIPPPIGDDKFVLAPLPKESQIYMDIVKQMQVIPNFKVVSIEQIRNPSLELTYHSLKQRFEKECENQDPNEKCLFHGTSPDAANSILNEGFNQQYFSLNGLYGNGAYFADNPKKSDQYVRASSKTQYYMFYCQVILGKMFDMNKTDSSLHAAPKGYHSVRGTWHSELTEYIIYDQHRALPYVLIIYEK